MTPRQLFVIKSLFESEARHATSDACCEVLHDAPAADIFFMEQLIAEGSVIAYKTRSSGCGLPCFEFRGFTSQGHKIYRPFVAESIPDDNTVEITKEKDASNAAETSEA